jgi:hypothetical protein
MLTIIYSETFITVYDDSQQQAFRMMSGVYESSRPANIVRRVLATKGGVQEL